MPNIIDELVTVVRLDPTQFEAGRAQVSASLKRITNEGNKTAKELEANGKRMAQFFASAKSEALGLIGALVGAGGLTAFVKDTTASLAQLGRDAKNVGLTAQQLAAFQNVIERNGGSAEDATQSLLGYVNAVERFKVFGDPTVFKFLNPIGASIEDSPIAVFEKFIRFAAEHKNDVPLVNLIGHGLGFDQGLINASLQIGDVTKAVRELGNEMGRVPTQQQVKDATDLQMAWVDLQHQAQTTGRAVEDQFVPALKDALVWYTQLLKDSPAQAGMLASMAASLSVIAALNFGSVTAFLGRASALAALLGFTGPAGGEDPAFSAEKNKEYLKNNPPGSNPLGDWLRQHLPTWLGGAPTPAVATADTTMSPAQRSLLDAIAMGEQSSAGYASKNPNSTAFGRYQFLAGTDADVSRETGIFGNDPISQDRKAWFLAASTYYKRTGRDLAADLAAGGHEDQIAAALNGVWPSLPGGSQQNTTAAQFALRLHDRLAANRTQATADARWQQGQQMGAIAGGPPIRIDPALLPTPGGSVSTPSNTSTSSTSVQISNLNVNTQATDAAGIAGGISDAVTDSFVQQANRGLQ